MIRIDSYRSYSIATTLQGCTSEDGKCSVTMGFHGQASSGPQTRLNEFPSKSLPSWMAIITICGYIQWILVGYCQWILWYVRMLCDIYVYILIHLIALWSKVHCLWTSSWHAIWFWLFPGHEAPRKLQLLRRFVRRLWWADSSRGRTTVGVIFSKDIWLQGSVRMLMFAEGVNHLPMMTFFKFLIVSCLSRFYLTTFCNLPSLFQDSTWPLCATYHPCFKILLDHFLQLTVFVSTFYMATLCNLPFLFHDISNSLALCWASAHL